MDQPHAGDVASDCMTIIPSMLTMTPAESKEGRTTRIDSSAVLQGAESSNDAQSSNPPHVERIEDAQYLTSYNWFVADTPTIIVPGRPRKMRGSPNPIPEDFLQPMVGGIEDPDLIYRASHSLEPAVRALFWMNPDYSPSNIQYFTCVYTMDRLLRFCGGGEGGFCFDIQLIGPTMFLVQNKESLHSKQGIPPATSSELGCQELGYQQAWTEWEPDVGESTACQRIVQYRLFGKTFAVRFGCCAYRKELQENSVEQQRPVNTSASEVHASSSQQPALTVKHGGEVIVQDAVFELRVPDDSFFEGAEDWIYPVTLRRAWLSQIPYICIAAGARAAGTQYNLSRSPVYLSTEFAEFENENADTLRKFSNLLQWMDFLLRQDRARPITKFRVERVFGGDIQIRPYIGNSAPAALLPPDLTEKWARG